MPGGRVAGLVGVVAVAGVACRGDGGTPPPTFAFDSLCTVQAAFDGDTIQCLGGRRIRLIGMDTPEMDQVPFGDQSRDALLARIALGTTVRLERDVELRDAFDRTLAYVWVQDSLVNETMVRQGWAVTFVVPPNAKYEARLAAAEAAAQNDLAGHWATGGFVCLPADHRAGRC
jgi:micrococcal nuclease